MKKIINIILILIACNVSFAQVNNKEETDKISKNLRCLICQGQSIYDSQSDFAISMKIVIEKKIIEGLTEDEIYDYLKNQYGQWILYDPELNKKTFILNLIDTKTGKLSTHTLRFWEKEFKEIKPFIFAGNRRYYDDKCIKLLKKIQFLLKNKGMTIKGVKKQLKIDNSNLDELNNKTINKKILKTKLKKISNILKNIKTNG